MTDRYDVLHARKSKEGKAFWTKCGVALPNRDGTGFNIILNYLPAPISGEGYQFAMLKPKPKDDARRESRDDGDSIPF